MLAHQGPVRGDPGMHLYQFDDCGDTGKLRMRLRAAERAERAAPVPVKAVSERKILRSAPGLDSEAVRSACGGTSTVLEPARSSAPSKLLAGSNQKVKWAASWRNRAKGVADLSLHGAGPG